MRYKRFCVLYAGHTCRSCINAELGAHLRREDCLYETYPYQCTSCGEMKNIVYDIKRRSRHKLWFKKPLPSSAGEGGR